ncbi:MAG: ABC transporter ATP-binding protein [Phenylobacterium sp.]|nr:ABC transporter ATP-binding protein [Hydrogenophilales bacterium]MBP8247618.1 ABC transporter ATP-binding protein [Phenylobacterium sp.]MBP8901973.1 ABC transporter ATP-binding protein [Thiobacillaceae bacterium]MBP9915621.1 ABC transporter ATP-binding protein [Thiobacillaceae bacterium]
MIELRHVTKQFKKSVVLDDLDLDIAAGERVALIGSNGAGKTTLIRCLLGEYVHAGELSVLGLNPRQGRADLLRRVGFVPQLPPPLRMSVGDLLRFAGELAARDPARFEEVAARLGLETAKVRHLPFVKLSGGMKQKILIAIALGRDCELLILDEPAANLDPEARHAFFGLLAERLGRATMLISSHRLDEVAPLVNRVLELDMGRVVLDDRVADDVALAGRIRCRLVLRREEQAIAKALAEWGLSADGLVWRGDIAGPDRLRFLGMLARYVGVLTHIELEEQA